MPRKHPPVTEATAKQLYATAVGCAEPDCNAPLYRTEADGIRTLNSRIAHICARSEGGPRWDSQMESSENRSSKNLLLLCIEHADVVDQKALEKRFPVPKLQEWKRSQIADYERVVESGREAGWHLTDDEAAEVVDESERSTNISLTADTIIVGGMGGQPLGAGGGGGVIGTGSLVGGRGGDVQIPKLDGEPGKFPGGGGGGAGALDYQGPWIPHTGSGTAGSGYIAGVDGNPGGDTVFASGDIEIRAKGGTGGLAGTGKRSQTEHLHVSTLLLANYISIDGGLAHMIHGAWQSWNVVLIPTRLTLPIFCVIEAGGADAGEYTIVFEAHSPSGELRARQSIALVVDESAELVRVPYTCALEVEADELGMWRVTARSDTKALGAIDLIVKQPDSP
jgi:hypothetical protein